MPRPILKDGVANSRALVSFNLLTVPAPATKILAKPFPTLHHSQASINKLTHLSSKVLIYTYSTKYVQPMLVMGHQNFTFPCRPIAPIQRKNTAIYPGASTRLASRESKLQTPPIILDIRCTVRYRHTTIARVFYCLIDY